MLAICHYSDKVFEKPTYVTPTTIFSRTPPKKFFHVQRGVFHRTSFDGLQHACDKVHSIIACSVAIATIASSSSSSIYSYRERILRFMPSSYHYPPGACWKFSTFTSAASLLIGDCLETAGKLMMMFHSFARAASQPASPSPMDDSIGAREFLDEQLWRASNWMLIRSLHANQFKSRYRWTLSCQLN